MDCLFCSIIKGDIPSTVVYETEDLVAIKDIAPQAPFHVIIIPKQHIPIPAHVTAENSDISGKMILAAAEIAKQENLENGSVLNSDSGATALHLKMTVAGCR